MSSKKVLLDLPLASKWNAVCILKEMLLKNYRAKEDISKVGSCLKLLKSMIETQQKCLNMAGKNFSCRNCSNRERMR